MKKKKVLKKHKKRIKNQINDFIKVYGNNAMDFYYALCQSQMYYFVNHCFAAYEPNWHHVLIANTLDKFLRGGIKNLIINMPPQHGKSSNTSRYFPSYALGVNPNLKIGLCSYGADLAQSFNRDVQRIMMDEPYRQIFPNSMLNHKNVATDSKGSYKRTSNIFEIVGYRGSLKTVGIGGSLTGNPLDIGIIDDPLKDYEEAMSKRARDRCWNWYQNVFLTRMHNDSKQLITMTRWHDDDLVGRILSDADSGDWHVLKIPAIKYDRTVFKKWKYGTALWEKRHSLKRLRKIEDRNPEKFDSLYQQEPTVKGGNIFKRKYFGEFSIIEDYDLYAFIDGAYTKDSNNDATAILKGYVNNNRFYVVDVANVRLEFPELIEFLEVFLDDVRLSYVEPKATGKSIVQTLKRKGFRIAESTNPVGDKVQRANSIVDDLKGGAVLVYKYMQLKEQFYNQLEKFPKGSFDDMVDTLVMAVDTKLTKNTKEQNEANKNKKKILKGVRKIVTIQ